MKFSAPTASALPWSRRPAHAESAEVLRFEATVQARTELGVGPVVLGPVDHDALPALVAAAGVFAFPSTKEGFGLAEMEALAAGVAVVVANLPVFREIFTGVARFAADPAELAAQLSAGLTEPDAVSREAGRPLHLGSRYATPP
jgi:glycosyltransferase involved in cell wall biosynthesis